MRYAVLGDTMPAVEVLFDAPAKDSRCTHK